METSELAVLKQGAVRPDCMTGVTMCMYGIVKKKNTVQLFQSSKTLIGHSY